MICPLFRGKGKNPGKNSLLFFGDLKTPKVHFEINWSLVVHVKGGGMGKFGRRPWIILLMYDF